MARNDAQQHYPDQGVIVVSQSRLQIRILFGFLAAAFAASTMYAGLANYERILVLPNTEHCPPRGGQSSVGRGLVAIPCHQIVC